MARVVLTQPSPRVDALAGNLRASGHEVLALPLSRIVEHDDDRAVRATMARLADFDWVIPVSPAAVHAAARSAGAAWPATLRVAVVGPGSAQAIVECGLPIDASRLLHPSEPPFDADALIELPPLRAPAGLRVLVLRGSRGNDRWIERLRERGAAVEVCALYEHQPLEVDANALETLRAWLAGTGETVFVVTQAATVAPLERALVDAGLREAAHRRQAWAIHPRIARTLAEAGWKNVRSIAPGDRGLMHALESASDSSGRNRV